MAKHTPDAKLLARTLAARTEQCAGLLAALKDLLDVTNGVRGLPNEDDGPCETLCGNSWCYEFGCIPLKFAAARTAIKKAEAHE
jgi:hypothetical protein